MNRIFFLISIIAALSCKSITHLPKVDSFYYYESFDLFFLEGDGKSTNKNAKKFVKVGYINGSSVPSYIVFKRNGPLIRFVLRDSFQIDKNNIVYEYYTKNFFGEPPGKHFDFGGSYGWSYNEYFIYINKSSSFYCKKIENYEIPDVSPLYKYFIDEEGILFKCIGDYKHYDNQVLTKEEQYIKWIKYFGEKGTSVCNKATLIPK